jgi:hypothetical protein
MYIPINNRQSLLMKFYIPITNNNHQSVNEVRAVRIFFVSRGKRFGGRSDLS